MKIAIGGDHAAFDLKEYLKKELKENYEIRDFGPPNKESIDYPDVAHPMARSLENNEIQYIIAICGSANGINMTLNKYSFIRSAICWNEEIAELARLHNDANAIALPARFMSNEAALQCVKKFLTTSFEGGRHLRRVNKIKI
jgi:ribose 5-phosphate isomerase B